MLTNRSMLRWSDDPASASHIQCQIVLVLFLSRISLKKGIMKEVITITTKSSIK
jgi:hypothetical protein